jgi:hypothetical protein
LAIEYRWAEGHYDRLPALAADLVGHKVDLIIATALLVHLPRKARRRRSRQPRADAAGRAEPQAFVNIGSGYPSGLSLKTSFTGIPTSMSSKSQSTMFVIIVVPSLSRT